jgi:2-polyprenyl-6-methoxyphenol hydroxylase-like FAD-dependent oxidoreductase
VADNDCVLIAGAGPVGIITGLYLARAGIPVKLFDELAEVPTDHRAATLQPSTLRMFDEIGLTEKLIPRGIKSPIFQFRDRVTDTPVAEFDFGLLENETPYPFALQIEQHKTIYTALEMARGYPEFEIRRPCAVTEVDQRADHVEIEVTAEDGSRERHRGRYLIGCDGGRSVVRKSQDIEFPGFTWRERFIICATPFDFAAAGGYRYRNYVAHPDQWCALMKVPGEDGEGIWRCLFPAMTDEPDEVVIGDDWIQARFAECLPFIPEYQIVHRNLYVIHQRVAKSFRAGRVLLAGDSAHVNNPIGGMGMNGGIHDGINLAGKMIRVWRGEADDDLFDLYDRQRRPMATKYVQAQSIQNKETLQEKDPDKRRQRFDELRAIAADPERHRAYLRRTSLIAMVAEADSIT